MQVGINHGNRLFRMGKGVKMAEAVPTDLSLDEVCARSLAGDDSAESLLFHSLRVRFTAIAKRRVQQDHIEDIVQDALQTVLRKYRERSRSDGILVWSLTVLRNVIGNYYQARKRESERLVQVQDWQRLASSAPSGTSTSQLETDQFVWQLEQAIAALAQRYPRCGKIFTGLLSSLEEGGGPREISQRALDKVCREQPDLTPNNFYVTLHRCRAHLRLILAEQEEGYSHG
jgi:DNA-directed RNA polymerase specialized sigma24 family protein